MGNGAAFFDLDRTLLKGASGPVISQALAAAGVLPERSIPGQGLVFKVFDIFGENLPSMAVTRSAARAAKGWVRSSVQQAGEIAGETLERMVTPFSRPVIEEHRKAGRPIVLATTTPYDVVAPLARRLGFDDVLATRYAIDPLVADQEIYNGRIDGNFVWSNGKLAAVRAWAAANRVDLSESYAYSDSVFDLPLLSAVGHPHAVNPDARLAVVAALRRWPVVHFDAPPGVPKFLGIEPAAVLRAFARPEAFPFARFDIAGGEHIPKSGPAIVVANHRSYFDTAAVGLTIMRAGRLVRFLGKKEVFDAPVVGPLARAMGGIRVDRGSGSGEPLQEAAAALAGGEVVALMPQGTIPRGEAFFEPVLVGRSGAARLAAMTGAPVIPMGVWGTELVWPRSSRVPNVTNVTSPPTVRVRVGAPVTGLGLGPDDAKGDTERIMEAIMDLLPPESRVKKIPTAEELARTKPPN